MKKSASRFVAAIAALGLGACATPQMMTVPATTSAPAHYVGPSPTVAQQFNHMVRPLDDQDSIIYLQSFGGGGVGLGLLGPFGVAANIKMIESNTDADVQLLKGKIPLDPQSLLSTVANDYPALTQASDKDKAVRLTPLINVVKAPEERLLFGCSLIVDYTAAGTSWVGRYVYQMPLQYTKDEVAKGLSHDQHRILAEEAKAGFRALAQMYVDDMSGKLPAKRDLKFKSSFVAPRWEFEMIGQEMASDESRIAIRSIGYVYSLPKKMTQVIY